LITKKNMPRRWPLILLTMLIVALVVFLMQRLEGKPPEFAFEMDSPALGARQTLTMEVADVKSGLRNVWVGVIQEGREAVLLDKTFPSEGILKGGSVNVETLEVAFVPRDKGITDGDATLRLVARDYSWRRWGKGNIQVRDLAVRIDTRPPVIEVLSRQHYLAQGGSGLVIYKLSEACTVSGVMVGDQFYPGYAGGFSDAAIHMALFAVDHQQGPGTPIHVRAVDFAGNEGRAGIPHLINVRRFKRDTLPISDGFLDRLMPAFFNEVDAEPGASNFDIFLKVNKALRYANDAKIRQITAQSDQRPHWQAGFLQLPNSANRAGFADHRTYTYNGKVIDEQYHMGIDLASLSQAPVPAANNGRVVFADMLGIYGNTVIIDHGMGLFSMYSHLSYMEVMPERMVVKGETIGKTGVTGLAVGDHLHFSMLVHHTFVNPLEWWDGLWVQNNITSKIEAVERP
jgi:hypothetical protein